MSLKEIKGVGVHSFSCTIATLDLVTDTINGLDLLGLIYIPLLCNNVKHDVQKIWGSISLFIIFVPGILMAIPKILESMYKKEFLEAILSFFLMLVFPLIFPIFQLLKIMQIVPIALNNSWKKLTLT